MKGTLVSPSNQLYVFLFIRRTYTASVGFQKKLNQPTWGSLNQRNVEYDHLDLFALIETI